MSLAITSVLPRLLRAHQKPPVERFIDAREDRPVVELDYFFVHHELFCDLSSPQPEPAALQAYWDPAPKSVALKPWFPLQVTTLTEPACEDLQELEPGAIAGPVDVLRGVAQAVEQGRLRLAITHGVIAFSGIGRPLLLDADRDLFWRVFQVPLFEQFRGFQGELLASECEKHHGLHVQPGQALWETRSEELVVTSLGKVRYPVARLATGIQGEIETGACDCGLDTPRVYANGLLTRAAQ